jgi:FkbM family methyltransferase
MLCFDIGANIGRWTIANKNKFDKIVCIEAAPIVYDKLLLTRMI